MKDIEIGPIRPPSESNSLLIRVTRGCHWNKCYFCGLYKSMQFSIPNLISQFSFYISFTNSRFIGSYYDSLVLMIQHILTKHNIRVVTMKRRLSNFCIIESYGFDSMVPEHPARPDNCFPIGTLRPK